MKTLKLFLITAALASVLHANAIVGDLTAAFGAALPAGVYTVPVMNNIFVPAGATFNIDPGVTINFRNASYLRTFPGSTLIIHENTLFQMMRDSRFIIGGNLLVYGMPGVPVRFIEHPLNVGPSWDGIIFDGTVADSVIFDHAEIRDVEKLAGAGFVEFSGAIVSRNSNFNWFEIHNSKFIHNHVANFGGAFCFYNSNVTNPVRIDKCKFENNQSNNGGGAIYLFSPGTTDFKIEFCEFSANQANFGGAMAVRTLNIGDLNMFHNKFKDNIAANYGGGCFFNGNVNIINLIGNHFEHNVATTINGGALFANNFTHTFPLVMIFNVFDSNEAVNGGAVCSTMESGGDKLYLNNLFCYNHASNEGGAVYCEQQYSFVNNTMAYNTSLATSGAIYATLAAPGIAGLNNNILWGNGPNQVCAALEGGGFYPLFTYCDIDDVGPLGGGNITTDPLFIDPAMKNFRLSTGTPCYNAGDPAFVSMAIYGSWFGDLDASPRVQGGRVDMGAYEQAPVKDALADISVGGTDISMSVYPNPAADYFILNRGTDNQETLEVGIYDMKGQKTAGFTLPSGESTGRFEIHNLNPGTYMIRITGEGYLKTQKLQVH